MARMLRAQDDLWGRSAFGRVQGARGLDSSSTNPYPRRFLQWTRRERLTSGQRRRCAGGLRRLPRVRGRVGDQQRHAGHRPPDRQLHRVAD